MLYSTALRFQYISFINGFNAEITKLVPEALNVSISRLLKRKSYYQDSSSKVKQPVVSKTACTMDWPGLKYSRLENQKSLAHFPWELTLSFQSLRNIGLLLPIFFNVVYILCVYNILIILCLKV